LIKYIIGKKQISEPELRELIDHITKHLNTESIDILFYFVNCPDYDAYKIKHIILDFIGSSEIKWSTNEKLLMKRVNEMLRNR